MTLDESIQGMRLQVIRRAAEIGVSAACHEAGISRTLFYRGSTDCLAMAWTACIHADCARDPAPARSWRHTPSAACSPWRSPRPRGARRDWPRMLSGSGGCASPPAPCSACCAGMAWPRGASGCWSSSIRAPPARGLDSLVCALGGPAFVCGMLIGCAAVFRHDFGAYGALAAAAGFLSRDGVSDWLRVRLAGLSAASQSRRSQCMGFPLGRRMCMRSRIS